MNPSCMLANPNSNHYSVTVLCRFPSKLLELHEYFPFGNFKSSNRGVEKSPNRWIRMIVALRDRSKNRKPLQKGRVLSIEAIQAVQSLKRSKTDSSSLQQALRSKFCRLLRLDMIAVLRDLLRQKECLLALQVFKQVRKEHWYKPQLKLYAELIAVLADSGLSEDVELTFRYLKMDSSRVEADLEGYNALLKAVTSSVTIGTALSMECIHLMKASGCEPNRDSFRILINGLESRGEATLSAVIRQQAMEYYGESLELLLEEDQLS